MVRARRRAQRRLQPRRVIAIEDGLDLGEVLLVVGDDDRPVDDRVDQALRDLGLAAARHRARLVAEGAVGPSADQAPAGRGGMALEPNLVAAGMDVGDAGAQGQAARHARLRPPHGARGQIDLDVLGDQQHARIRLQHRIALGHEVDLGAQRRDRLGKGVPAFADRARGGEAIAEVVAGEGQRAAGVLFLGQAHQVGGE